MHLAAGLTGAAVLGGPLAVKFLLETPPPVKASGEKPKEPEPPQPTSQPTRPSSSPTPLPVIKQELTTPKETLFIPWMPETVKRWSSLISEGAKKYNLDPNLLAVMILVESGGNFCAVSSAGATGLMQIMPANYPKDNLLIPKTNIFDGALYLSGQYKRFGDWEKAVAAYNAGPGRIQGGSIPAETQSYLKWVMGMWKEADKPQSEIFQEWWKWGQAFVKKAEQLYGNSTRLKAVDFATQQLHKKYVLGGNGPDVWDCSGLVHYAYQHAGITITRTATAQWQGRGRVLGSGEERLPGDLILFTLDKGRSSDHVGMFIFPPYVFIEATGTYGKVRITSLNSAHKLYRADLAKRVLGIKRIV